MSVTITEKTISRVSSLAKLNLSEEEKLRTASDMQSILDYMDRLNELDTRNVEPLTHLFPDCNVVREDSAENGDGSSLLLAGAPAVRKGQLEVPITIE